MSNFIDAADAIIARRHQQQLQANNARRVAREKFERELAAAARRHQRTLRRWLACGAVVVSLVVVIAASRYWAEPSAVDEIGAWSIGTPVVAGQVFSSPARLAPWRETQDGYSVRPYMVTPTADEIRYEGGGIWWFRTGGACFRVEKKIATSTQPAVAADC